MAKISTSDFRNGLSILLDGEIYTITEFQHVKPGKGPAFVRTKLKGVVNDKNIDKTYRSGENVESVRIETHQYQFLYRDGDMFFFMHQETYEQIPLEAARVEKSEFIYDGLVCTLVVTLKMTRFFMQSRLIKLKLKLFRRIPALKAIQPRAAVNRLPSQVELSFKYRSL